jgi:hypothetical protein
MWSSEPARGTARSNCFAQQRWDHNAMMVARINLQPLE